MSIYRINCEWDMGFKKAYKTIKDAEQAIKDADWSEVLEGPDDSTDKLMEDGLLDIEEIELD